MDPVDQMTAEHMEVCVEGTCRRIAMRRSDWDALQTKVPRGAFFRLRAAFKKFCSGCNNLPEQLFRRVPTDPYGRLEEFVADGVQVIGRRGTDDSVQTFFTIQVRIAAEVLTVVEPDAPRQAVLALEITVQKKGTER